MVFPIVAPSRPLWTIIWTILNRKLSCIYDSFWLNIIKFYTTKNFEWPHPSLHYIRKLSCKYELFWLSGSWEKDFYNINIPILAHVKTVSPTVASPDPKWPCFLQTCEFVQMSEIKLSLYDPVVFEKKILNIFPIQVHVKVFFFYCDPIRPLGTIIWTNLNLHYIRNLSCKCELF